MTLNELSLSTFDRVLNTAFRLQVDAENKLELELVEVKNELKEKDEAPGRHAFSLTFRGSHPEPLPQGTYTLEHDDLGTMDIFLVPIRQDEAGVYYQAVFNILGNA